MKAANLKPQRTSRQVKEHRRKAEQLRQRLANAKAQLASFKRKQAWVEAALDTQRHARQVLEAAVAASYSETVARIRDIVCPMVPPEAIVLVVSKGDEELLNLDGRQGWHFPRGEDGGYAGYYPADSAEAINQVRSLVAKGAQFLLIPSTAFWWLEHYREFEEYLSRHHVRVWRDERCILYRLGRDSERKPNRVAAPPATPRALPTGPIVPPASPGRYDIVCFPIIDWGYRFQRPQQLMLQFAAAGHRVFYLSHQFRKSGEPYVPFPRAANLWEVALRGPRFRVHQGLLDAESRRALFASLTALRRGCSVKTAAAIVQLPFWWPLLKEAAAAFAWPVVYDCLDHHAGFSTSHPLTEDQERELFSRADLVVTSSAWLEAKARKHSRKVLLVRNACDYKHFANVQRIGPGLGPVVGYFGAITEWFDSDLVADLAERQPAWEFLLVGSTVGGDVTRLSKLPNVTLAGEKPYAELPGWLARFDVTILPFKRTPLTEATNPVKTYEILAAGKPLVSVPLPEMVPLVPLIRLASTAPEFEREILAELNRPEPGAWARRRAFARANSWKQRFIALASAIRKVFRKRGEQIQKAKRPARVRSA